MLSTYTDYQNNLLNRLAYCKILPGTWEKGSDLITVLNNNGENELAKRVKIADLKHNLDSSRLDGKEFNKSVQYRQALSYLTSL